MLIKNAPRPEYRLKNGTLVPGVTTVTGVLDKPSLLPWAFNGGKGSPPELTFPKWQEAQRDNTAGVGTIAHYKIRCYLSGVEEQYGEGWEEEHIKMAEVPFQTFMKWYNQFDHRQVILSEYSSVHEKQRYGGTLDLLLDTPNGVRLIDFKTSKRIYEENYIQVAAYKMLLSQDSRWRHMRIKEQVVLITKDGRLEDPEVSKAYMDKARATWDRLIKMYHKLNEFRHESQVKEKMG